MSCALVLSALFLAAPRPSPAPQDAAAKSDLDWIDKIVSEEALTHGVPGLGLSIVAHGKVVAERAYGFADVERELRVTTSTGFNIASTSKPFTAIAVLRMASRGEIDLDAPAKTYVEWLPGTFAGITIRQLLTHTSGIVRDVRTGNEDDPTREEYRERILVAEKSAEPGARWEYSNVGYAVLGWAAEAASKIPFDRLLAREVFAVAKMPGARFRTPITEPERAQPYRCAENTAVRATYVSGGFGSGGLILGMRDFTAFAQALQSGSLLPESMQELAWSPGHLADGRATGAALITDSDSYGCGWILSRFAEHRLVAHGGGIQGFSAYLFHFPDDELTIAVAANVKARDDGRAPVDPIARRLAEPLLRKAQEAPR